MRVAVLASGTGTLLDAILTDGVPVSLVVTDRPCRAREVAERHGVPVAELQRPSFGPSFDREGYTRAVTGVLLEHDIELVVSAGYGTILGQPVHDAFPNRILNTHPALLPAFKGWHAVEAALAYGVKVTGCTVHVVTLAVDAGPILAQEPVPVLDGDTVDTLHERIKEVERRLYPDTIRAVLADPTQLDDLKTPEEIHP